MTHKLLGRTGMALSPFGPMVIGERPPAATELPGAPANWCSLPVTLPAAACARAVSRLLPEEGYLFARVGPACWDRQMSGAVRQLISFLDRRWVEVLMLAPFDLERIKAGEPFRRLAELREAGLVRYIGVYAQSLRDARWVVENTPAHVVMVDVPGGPGGGGEDGGWAELFEIAGDAETGLIAGPSVADGDLRRASRWLEETPVTAFAWPVE